MPFCPDCGERVPAKAAFCPGCGKGMGSKADAGAGTAQAAAKPSAPQPQVVEKTGSKSPFIALILSFFWPGLGQIYNGRLADGIIIMVLYMFFILLSFFLIGIPFVFLIWLYSMYDAYKKAKES